MVNPYCPVCGYKHNIHDKTSLAKRYADRIYCPNCWNDRPNPNHVRLNNLLCR